MAGQSGGNTQFGALLVLTPLAAAASDGRLSPSGVDAVVRGTTVEDAAAFYRAFEHVDVAVDDPPDGLEPLDVRRGSDAIPELRARETTLFDVMESSADIDGVAAEWVSGFERGSRPASGSDGSARSLTARPRSSSNSLRRSRTPCRHATGPRNRCGSSRAGTAVLDGRQSRPVSVAHFVSRSLAYRASFSGSLFRPAWWVILWSIRAQAGIGDSETQWPHARWRLRDSRHHAGAERARNVAALGSE